MTTIHPSSMNGHHNANGRNLVGPAGTAAAVNGLSPVAPNYINPAQMNAQAGPSSSNGQSKKKSAATNGKRRRSTDTPEGDCTPTGQQQRKNRDGPRKKKANRACFHCQKAHLTCDDTRPCQRCIKRGIGDNCTEGHRKKAKYLLDEEELEELKRSKSSSGPESKPSQSPQVPAAPQVQVQVPQPPNPQSQQVPIQTSEPFPPDDPVFNLPFDANFSFGSEAANLEYSILSAILGNPSPPDSGPTEPAMNGGSWSTDSMSQNQFGQSPSMDVGGYPSYDANQISIQPSETTLTASPTFMDGYAPVMPYGQMQNGQSPEQFQYTPQYAQQQQPEQRQSQFSSSTDPLHPLHPRYPREIRNSPGPTTAPTAFMGRSSSIDSIARAAMGTPSPSDSPASSSHQTSYLENARRGSQLQNINERVTRPYDYTEGYHFLMKHLPSRFEKNDILRIVRALAIFRPSLIAMQMPLTEEDEVFVEKCFQRSLLELDKLISFSGTPTVVWRRTGEICLVAPEFCMLTEWSMEELMGSRKYIYELFENQSVVEYYENFAEHAFENTTQSVYSHCVLLKPSGAPIPATFCFSIRRDIYDLPSLVIGQWLPLL